MIEKLKELIKNTEQGFTETQKKVIEYKQAIEELEKQQIYAKGQYDAFQYVLTELEPEEKEDHIETAEKIEE